MKQTTHSTRERGTLRVSGQMIQVPTLPLHPGDSFIPTSQQTPGVPCPPWGDVLFPEVSVKSTHTGIRNWREVVGMFISSEDVKESSRKLYTRTLSQFFLWVETGLLDQEREKLLQKGQALPEGVRKLNEMTREDILEYKDSLISSGLSLLTISSYLVVVRKFYTWTESLKIYPNIAKGIKTPKRKTEDGVQVFEKQYLTETKSRELLDYYREKSLRDFAIINLLLRTGLRTIEVVRADVGDITLRSTKEGERRVLYVWGKGHLRKDTPIVLSDKAYLPIKEYLDSRKGVKPGDPLFTSNSRQNKGERLTTRTISAICKEGLREIGLDGREFTAHSLRHTCASTILEKGGTLFDVLTVLRHSSIDTSRIYVKMKERELRLQTPPEFLLDSAF